MLITAMIIKTVIKIIRITITMIKSITIIPIVCRINNNVNDSNTINKNNNDGNSTTSANRKMTIMITIMLEFKVVIVTTNMI